MPFLWMLVASEVRGELHFAQPEADAGEVRGGQPLSHAFHFVNQGSTAVAIIGVRSSCGCVVPRLEQRSYQPGERGTVRLEVNTLAEPAGPHTWRVFVSCSGADSSELVLQLSARVITEITVRPAALTVHAENAVGHEVVLTDLRAVPLNIREVRTSIPWLTARLAEAAVDIEGHWQRRIQVALSAECPEGRHDAVLGIYTDDPGYPELRVPVTIVKRARSALTVTPSAVSLSAAAGQAVPSRLVLVRSADDQEVVVAGVDSDHPAVVCRWARGPGPQATVKITIDRGQVTARELQATVRVRVEQPVVQTLIVPVACTLE